MLGLAVLTVQHYQGRPLDVSVVYHYGQRCTELRSVSVVYQRAGEVVATARYSYRSQPAAPTQLHRLSLVPGEYTVSVDLTYAEGQGAVPPRDQRSNHLVRRVRVESEGEYSLHLDR